ncbi:pyruvate kinase [Pontiella agarivorans]|uniref:Pyruvate kinase n=1 Tax=Pontiella agarivorans TaxID=3038953 RepID=A0ABU5MV41_9BACT|nr:pyruvate kinase [Pontiella agarivorans]MDZ8118088.1 pyruvate kinase [Pontiella agarivorans]
MLKKQTKIICTIAGNRCEEDFLRKLHKAGMNVARLNTAHISTVEADLMVQRIRSVSKDIGILIDTKGPEVRTSGMGNEILELCTGDIIEIGDKIQPENGFMVNYEEFVNDVPIGSDVLIDDGEIRLTVIEKKADLVVCRAENNGVIKNNKSVNIPNVELGLPALTEKDAEFIDWATRSEIEFIAHSFVRNRDDVMAIQSILDMRKSPIKIIAKIENREGVDNLESILDVAHAVMVARGDLGIEIPAEEVPIIQKQMIKTCIRRIKPVITATQMLHTMIDNPRATRAEVSDVANAIYDGTDAVMLSGETAYGKYPVEAVTTMAEIARRVEDQKEDLVRKKLHIVQQSEEMRPRNHIARSAVSISANLPAKAIITSTKSGDTAMVCGSYRGKTPIYALSASARTVRELSLCYGIYARQIEIPASTSELVKSSVQMLLNEGYFEKDDLIMFIGGGQIYSSHTNFLQVETPATLLSS